MLCVRTAGRTPAPRGTTYVAWVEWLNVNFCDWSDQSVQHKSYQGDDDGDGSTIHNWDIIREDDCDDPQQQLSSSSYRHHHMMRSNAPSVFYTLLNRCDDDDLYRKILHNSRNVRFESVKFYDVFQFHYCVVPRTERIDDSASDHTTT
jgi:hypothetical protein